MRICKAVLVSSAEGEHGNLASLAAADISGIVTGAGGTATHSHSSVAPAYVLARIRERAMRVVLYFGRLDSGRWTYGGRDLVSERQAHFLKGKFVFGTTLLQQGGLADQALSRGCRLFVGFRRCPVFPAPDAHCFDRFRECFSMPAVALLNGRTDGKGVLAETISACMEEAAERFLRKEHTYGMIFSQLGCSFDARSEAWPRRTYRSP